MAMRPTVNVHRRNWLEGKWDSLPSWINSVTSLCLDLIYVKVAGFGLWEDGSILEKMCSLTFVLLKTAYHSTNLPQRKAIAWKSCLRFKLTCKVPCMQMRYPEASRRQNPGYLRAAHSSILCPSGHAGENSRQTRWQELKSKCVVHCR